MKKRVQDEKPARSAEARSGSRKTSDEQKKRHAAIQKEINEDLAPQRAKWVRGVPGASSRPRASTSMATSAASSKATMCRSSPDRPDLAVY